MISEFTTTVDVSKPLPTLTIHGEIDIYTCSELRDALINLIESHTSDIILNLEHSQYIDSTGLGTIAHSAQILSSRSASIHVICTRPQIKKIFEVSGLLKKNIILYDSETAIVATLEKQQ